MQNPIPAGIKKLRKHKNLSQHSFGKKVGLSGKTISAYETGRIAPPLKVLERIADTYNVEISSLLDDLMD